MPHTRAARLKAIRDASDLRDVLQLHETSANPGWNDYMDWDLPGLTYQPDALAWYPTEETSTVQQPFFADAHSPTANAVNTSLHNNYDSNSNTEFRGLQPWYSTTTRELSSVSPVATTRPQLSPSALTSYDSTPLDEAGQQADQIYGTQQWLPKVNRRRSSVGDGDMYPHRSDAQSTISVKEAEEHPSPSSEEENERISTAKSAAHKKRKIAHSVIEKNYRCRIKDGMAELRLCVPTREKGRRSLDSEGHPVTGDAASNQSSGKVAILSDAVQYVRALERKNEALHGQLDVMQRRNNTLQKIALSKVDTTVAVEEMEDEDHGEEVVGDGRGEQSKRSGGRGKGDGRSKAVAHSPSLTRKRHTSVTGTLAGITISGD
jgi:hypothetical protein